MLLDALEGMAVSPSQLTVFQPAESGVHMNEPWCGLDFVGMQQGPMEAQIKRLETETVKGYECDKYLFTFKNKEMGTMTQWFAIKLGYPIKIINTSDMLGEVITELQNIKKASVRDDLFIVPSDYQEINDSQIPQMPGENQ